MYPRTEYGMTEADLKELLEACRPTPVMFVSGELGIQRCYIGVWPVCGCIRFVTMDEPEYEKDNAKELARLIRSGYRVENIIIKEFKAGPRKFGCDHPDACPNPHNKERKAA